METDQQPNQPNLFEFVNYREYLKKYFETLKDSSAFFSYRYLEKITGLSRTYYKMVLDGRRNLTLASIAKISKAFKFSKKEAAYFEALVFYNQTRSEEERDRYFERMMNLRPPTTIQGLTVDEYEYATKTYFAEIREMTALPSFQEEPDWIRKNLRRPVSNRDIQHSLEVLERLKLLVRDEAGKLKHSGTTLESPLHANSPEILNYHRQLMTEGKEVITQAAYDQWDVGAMTIPIQKPILPQVMELLTRCREEIVQLVNRHGENYHEVYQINMLLFPVTKTEEKGKNEQA